MLEIITDAYFTKDKVKITTSNGKVIFTKIERFDEDKIYYFYKLNDNKESSIGINKIVSIEYVDIKKQRQFLSKKLGLPNNLENYLNYYKECLNELNKIDKNDKRIKLYRIFSFVKNSNKYKA